MQNKYEGALHDAIQKKEIDRIAELITTGPISSETINLVIETKNSEIADLFVRQILENSSQIQDILKQVSTKELISKAISINDFSFSYLALTLMYPPMKHELLARINDYKYVNFGFSYSLILLNQHNILTNDNVNAIALYLDKYDLKVNCPMIADCFIRLHQADLLSEDNRQLIINNPKLYITLVIALIKLKESDLISDEITLQAIIKQPFYYEEIITGLIQLKEANLLDSLSEDNRRTFLNNPSNHQEIVNGLKALSEEPDLFSNESTRQAIINHPTNYKEIIAGLIQLKAASLFTEVNRQLVIHNVEQSNPYYNYKNLIDDLITLNKANILSAQTRDILKRSKSQYIVKAIIDLHNENILDVLISLLPTIKDSAIVSVALGLFRLKQANLLTEQLQNLILENQGDAAQISWGLGYLKEHGFLSNEILQLLIKKPKINEVINYLSLLIEEKKVQNHDKIEQIINCYHDLMQLKDSVLTEEDYNLLIEQSNLTLAVNGLNMLRYSDCRYKNIQEYIVNCTRPGFAKAFKLLEKTGLLTKENLHKLIQEKDFDLNTLNEENIKEFITNSPVSTSESAVHSQDSLGISLHDAIKTEDVDKIEELVIAGPISAETIILVIQTKNSNIAQLFADAILKNIRENNNAQENSSSFSTSTKELINQAISFNDFNFSYLALTLLDPPMKYELLARINDFKYVNHVYLFTHSLIQLNKNNILTNDNVNAIALYMNNSNHKIDCSMIADCFIRLHQVDLLSEDNRQLIIDNPNLSMILVDALIKLKESDLISDEITLQAIIKQPLYYEEIITGLIQLKEANLLNSLSEHNLRAFLNNPSNHQEIVNGLKALSEEPDLFSNESTRQAIINTPYHSKEIIAGLIQLKTANLLNKDNSQLIVQNIVESNYKNLIDDMITLNKANILSADTGEILKRSKSPNMVNVIIDLHNENILDVLISLLPTITNSQIFSVALGLYRLKQANILTEQSQNLILENQQGAAQISWSLARLKEQGFLPDDTLHLLSKNHKFREIIDYLSSLVEKNSIQNAENIKQIINCYDELLQLKPLALTNEDYQLLFQQSDLTLAVTGLNKLQYSSYRDTTNLQEYIVNCTRPGFAEIFELLEHTGLLTEENFHKLIQQKDIDLINKGIDSLVEKRILTKKNIKEFTNKMTQHDDFSKTLNEYLGVQDEKKDSTVIMFTKLGASFDQKNKSTNKNDENPFVGDVITPNTKSSKNAEDSAALEKEDAVKQNKETGKFT